MTTSAHTHHLGCTSLVGRDCIDMLAGVLREVALEDYGGVISLHYETDMVGVTWEEEVEVFLHLDHGSGFVD